MDEAELAKIYEVVHHKRGKDYRAEAQHVAELVRTRVPDASSLLDVACGPGAHLRYFTALFTHTEGLELSESMLGIAHAKAPQSRLHRGDMRTFTLDRTFDAVTCMFGSVGYTRDEDELNATVERFAMHTRPGGVVIVEPWWFDERFTDGHVSSQVVEAEGLKIARISHSRRVSGASLMEVHYVTAGPDTGVRHFAERHEIRLFTQAQYERAFERAGLITEYLADVQYGRGLFVGVHAPAGPTRSGRRDRAPEPRARA